jgi:hypothetical protein
MVTAKSLFVALLHAGIVALAWGCGPAAVGPNAVGSAAGGPAVFEMRLQSLPARESGCALEWLPQLPAGAPAPIGTVTLTRGVPVDDPIGASVRSVVGPHACAMGGSRVAFVHLMLADTRPLSASYVVLPRAGTGPE